MKKILLLTVLILVQVFVFSDYSDQNSVSYWVTKFDEQFQDNMDDLWTAHSLGYHDREMTEEVGSMAYYRLSYGLDALTAMYEVTGNTSYLDHALTYIDNVKDAIQGPPSPDFGDNYQGWLNLMPGSHYEEEVPLYESCMWRYVTKLLRIIKQTPALYNNANYRTRYDSLLSFTEEHMWEKWYARSSDNYTGSWPFKYLARARTHIASHWAYMAADLYLISEDNEKKAQYEQIFTNFNRELLENMYDQGNLAPDTYGWHCTWDGGFYILNYDANGDLLVENTVHSPDIIQDTSHGNHVISYIIEEHEQYGYWNNSHLQRFINTVKDILWYPNDYEFYDFVDGTYGIPEDSTYEHTGRRQSDGWVKLARFNSYLQSIYEDFLNHNPDPNHASQLAQLYANLALNKKFINEMTIDVISPNGGEELNAGLDHTIRWNSTGFIGEVQIHYSPDNGNTWNLIEDSTANDGSYNWTVPGNQSSTCLVRISETLDEYPSDVSNAVFSIVSNPAITMTTPNGGENWWLGSTYPVTWQSNIADSLVRIVLLKGTVNLGIIKNDTANTGSFDWNIGTLTNGHVIQPGSDYRVRVIVLPDKILKDASDNYFTISTPPSITITSPNGGEDWQLGSTQAITWNAVGLSDTIKITLWKDGVLVGNITSNNIDPSPGSYTWTVGNLYDGTTAAPGTGYTIKIKEKGTIISDFSDASFTLRQADIDWWGSASYNGDKITGRVVSGDFDRDGKEDDIVAFYDYGSNVTKAHVWLSTGSGLAFQGSSGWWSSVSYDGAKITGRVVCGDFDRDGYKDDIAAFYDYGNNITKIHVWKSTGSSLSFQGSSGWWESASYNGAKITGRVVCGDFDRDGKEDDIVAFYDYGNNVTKAHVWTSTGSGFTFQGSSGWWESTSYNGAMITDRVVCGDFDRDGYKDDITAFYDYGNNITKAHVWKSTGTGLSFQGSSGWWSSSSYDGAKITGRVVAGDFDRDGYTDDITAFYDYGNNITKAHVWKSTGSSLSFQGSSGWWSSSSYTADKITGRVISLDINQDDKKDDILAFYYEGNNLTEVHVWTSSGSSLVFQ